MQDVYIVGGHINYNSTPKGNVFAIPPNEYAELNMFLDPLAAKMVFDSGLNITLIPLGIQRKVNAFPKILERLHRTKRTPEAIFARRLISRLHWLQQKHDRYQHMVCLPNSLSEEFMQLVRHNLGYHFIFAVLNIKYSYISVFWFYVSVLFPRKHMKLAFVSYLPTYFSGNIQITFSGILLSFFFELLIDFESRNTETKNTKAIPTSIVLNLQLLIV